jgi:hypothetical protein
VRAAGRDGLTTEPWKLAERQACRERLARAGGFWRSAPAPARAARDRVVFYPRSGGKNGRDVSFQEEASPSLRPTCRRDGRPESRWRG